MAEQMRNLALSARGKLPLTPEGPGLHNWSLDSLPVSTAPVNCEGLTQPDGYSRHKCKIPST